MSSLAKDLGQADGDPQLPTLPYGEDIEATWNYLEAGINRIMLESASGIDLHSLMGLYSVVYSHCTSQKAITYQRRDRSSLLLRGEDIYMRLSEFLGEYLTNLKQRAKSFSGEALLRFYIEEWVHYVRSARSIDRILAYLNRHWIKREVDEGKKNIYNVHTLYLVKWFREFYSEISGDVTDIVLKLVEKDRDSESNENGPLNQINAIVDSLASLDLDGTNQSKYSSTTDLTHLEKFFIEVITAYFEAGPDQLLPERLVSEYRMALSRLKDEEERVFLYLHPNIMPQLSQICNTTATLKLATGDLAVINVDRPVAECSVVIKHLLEDVGDEAVRNTSIPLPNVNEAVLRKVLQWCEHHKNNCHEPAIATGWSISYSDEWDQNYMQMDQDMLFDVIKAANYLDIKPLLDLGCRTIANMIKGMSPEQIRRTFNITNDFTPEEEEQIRRENEWEEW